MKVNATQFKIRFYASPIYTMHSIFYILRRCVVWSVGNLCIYLLYSPFACRVCSAAASSASSSHNLFYIAQLGNIMTGVPIGDFELGCLVHIFFF